MGAPKQKRISLSTLKLQFFEIAISYSEDFWGLKIAFRQNFSVHNLKHDDMSQLTHFRNHITEDNLNIWLVIKFYFCTITYSIDKSEFYK